MIFSRTLSLRTTAGWNLKKKEILRFIFDQLKDFKFRILFIFISMIFITVIGVITPLFGQRLFDDGILERDMQAILRCILIIAGLFLLEQLIQFLQFTQYEYINRAIPYRLLEKAFRHSLDLKISYYKDNSFYKVINNTFSDINYISQIANANIIQTSVSLFKIIGGMIGLAIINWKMMLLTVCIIPVSLMLSQLFSVKKRKCFQAMLDANEKFSMWISETLSGVELVKLWNLKKRKHDEFETYQRNVLKQNRKMEYLDNANGIAGAFVQFFLNYGLILLGAFYIMKDSLTVGGLYAFISYSGLIIQPMELIAEIVGRLSSSIPSFERYIGYFRNETEDVGSENKLELSNVIPIETITFDRVDFGYSEEKQLLKKVSFTVHKGEKVAFIGLNGSGKSSVLSLLLRLYEPDHGRILLNGTDIARLRLEEYRDLFGVMTQQAYLLNDTIKNNIDIRGELSEEEIGQFAEVVMLTEYLKSLPDGVDTKVGHNGAKLSGGEKQRIALARSLGKKSRILVLDEATANFDLKIEQSFREYIRNTERYDSIFVVTHRMDILEDMDRIFVMEDGEIIESGSYRELIDRGVDIRKLLLREEKENGRCD